jgi:hypothetical protein
MTRKRPEKRVKPIKAWAIFGNKRIKRPNIQYTENGAKDVLRCEQLYWKNHDQAFMVPCEIHITPLPRKPGTRGRG